MKSVVRNLMRVSGAFTPFRLANRNRPLILMYHRFSRQEDPTTTSARAFRGHLRYLTAHYRLVPLSKIADYLTSGEPLPPGLAAITIDDGYQDSYEIAFPLLQRYQVPATLFPVTDFIDQRAWLWTDKLKFILPRTTHRWVEVSLQDNLSRIELSDDRSKQLAATHINSLLKAQSDTCKERALCELSTMLGVALPEAPPEEFHPLTWDQVRELDGAGVEIGSHTVTHPILTRTEPLRIHAELSQSKARLESELNRKVDLFCYPNGNYDEQVVRETERVGYRCAVTTDFGLNDPSISPLMLKRIPAESDLARFVQITSGFEQVKNRLASAPLLAGGKSAMKQPQISER
jgi:peptidoglycan/xylan/chitin deacetylase (PgdA/CDA1 family)